MARKNRKIIFPAGIFLLIFFTQSILGSIALSAYTYISLKKNITAVEEYNRRFSQTLAEAFASVAELSLKTSKTEFLKTLFHEKIQQNTIDEAIFILADGRLIVHSNTSVEKGLGGNIANDEMAYNLDLILEPVKKNSHELFISDYNIVDRKIPFSMKERELISRYIYPGINTTGWLFSKAVFLDEKPAGSVCFLTGKERIYTLINDAVLHTKKYLYAVITGSFIISFVFSLFILARYRSIQKKAERIARTTGFSRSKIDKSAEKSETRVDEHPSETQPSAPTRSVIDDFDLFVDEPVGDTIIDKEHEISVDLETSSTHDITTSRHAESVDKTDDGYITVELLGEIENESPALNTQKPAAGDYIARRIPAESLGKNGFKEVRDAIPAGKGR